MFDHKKRQKGRRESQTDKFAKTFCLENKVKKLEAEVRTLKESGGFRSTSFKKDGKMKLEKLLDSIIG
jgi:hypothetical protein